MYLRLRRIIEKHSQIIHFCRPAETEKNYPANVERLKAFALVTNDSSNSVTRFDEILSFWLKFLKVLGSFSKALFSVWQYIEPILAKNAIGQSFIVVNGQILKNNLPSGHTDCSKQEARLLKSSSNWEEQKEKKNHFIFSNETQKSRYFPFRERAGPPKFRSAAPLMRKFRQ